jgi:hypothetical protein
MDPDRLAVTPRLIYDRMGLDVPLVLRRKAAVARLKALIEAVREWLAKAELAWFS